MTAQPGAHPLPERRSRAREDDPHVEVAQLVLEIRGKRHDGGCAGGLGLPAPDWRELHVDQQRDRHE